jgi:hypothetical protein
MVIVLLLVNLIQIAKYVMEIRFSNVMVNIALEMVCVNEVILFVKHSINQMVIVLPAMVNIYYLEETVFFEIRELQMIFIKCILHNCY